MKTTRFLITTVFFCFTINLFSATITAPPKKNIIKQISATMDFPQNAKIENSETVAVNFEITENGKIKVNEINGNPTFTEHVKQKLENFVVKKFKDMVGENFYIKFSFKSDK